MSTDTDKRLLDILEAHGQKFLDSFKPHKAEENGRKRAAEEDTAESHRSTKLLRAETDLSESSPVDDYSDSAEEWTGLGDDAQVDDEYEVYSSAEEAVPLEGALCSNFMVNGTSSLTRTPRNACWQPAHPPINQMWLFFLALEQRHRNHYLKNCRARHSWCVRSFFRAAFTLPRLKSSKVSKLRDETQEQRGKGTADATDDEDEEL
jgi:hypothetical protein